MLRRLLPLTLLLTPAPALGSAPPEPPKALSFYEIASQVETKHPLMRAARAGLASLQAKLSQADWAYFPSFKLTAGATATPKVTGDALHSVTHTDTWGYLFTAQVQAVLPVYTFGKILSLRRAARQGVRIGQASVALARWELRYRLAQAWYGALLAAELKTILADGKKWLDKANTHMERLRDLDSDDYDQNEHLRLRARMAEFFAIEAENALLKNQSQHGLRLLTGVKAVDHEVPISARFLEPLAVPLKTAEHYVALARKHDPGMQIKRAHASAKEFLHDHKKAQVWPDLVIVGTANMATSDVIERQPSLFAVNSAHQLGVGGMVALRWNLDVPQRFLRAQEAGALAKMAALDTETAWQLTELKVRGLWQKLKNARSMITIYAKSKKAAQGWLMANWDLYDEGFGNFRDVMDALVQFYAKKFAYLQTIHDHNVLIYELSRALGHDIVKAAETSPASKK